jgi:hypothetical protein
MTTDPGASRQQATTSRPALTSRATTGQQGGPQQQPAPARQPGTSRVVVKPSPWPFFGAIVTLLLGVLLGIANQGADGTGMGLRVPALLAALLMVGQGVVDIKRHMPKSRVVEESETLLVDDGSGSGPRPTELAVVRQLPPPTPVTSSVVRPSGINLAVPITVMVLAAWLGLADLRVDAPTSLTVLSLIASFALFALGWSLLPARR